MFLNLEETEYINVDTISSIKLMKSKDGDKEWTYKWSFTSNKNDHFQSKSFLDPKKAIAWLKQNIDIKK